MLATPSRQRLLLLAATPAVLTLAADPALEATRDLHILLQFAGGL